MISNLIVDQTSTNPAAVGRRLPDSNARATQASFRDPATDLPP